MPAFAPDAPGVCKTDDAGKPLSIIAMISDKCPECGTDHIDVQSLSFAKVGRLREGGQSQGSSTAT